MDKADASDSDMDINDVENKLKQLELRKQKYDQLQETLDQSDELQISTTDPDARALPLHMNIVEMAYNVQSSVDDKHNLIAAYEVTNKKDTDALAGMAIKTQEALEIEEDEMLTVLADKGYYKGEATGSLSRKQY